MHNFQANYDKILKELNELEMKDNFISQIRKPKLSDKELIALNLTSEYISIDSDCQLFRILPKDLSMRIERSVYNRRSRNLVLKIEKIRSKVTHHLVEFEEYFVVDSMPLEVYKLGRSSRSKVCKEDYFSFPDHGFCASQNQHYYGYKLHAVYSVNGVFHSLDICPASVHDIHYLNDVEHNLENCVLLGDKGYLSADYQLNLFESSNIILEVPIRKNQNDYKKHPFIFRNARK